MLGVLLSLASPAAAQIPTPDSHFGFRLGTDRRLATADAIERYFTLVASQSDRVKLIDLGKSTDGHNTIAAVVSAPENIQNLDQIRAANARLSDPRTLQPDEARTLAATQKVDPRHRRQHPRVGGRRHAGCQRTAPPAGDDRPTGRCSTCCRTSSSS